MDSFTAQRRETSRPAYYRVPSRSSTKTAPVSGVYKPPPVTSTLRDPVYLYETDYGVCTPTPQTYQTTPRPTSRLSRESSMESTKQLTASQYLQVELEKQRRLDGHASSTMVRTNGATNSSSHSGQDRRDSSVRPDTPESQRPKSSKSAESAKLPEMGLRDMRRVRQIVQR